LAQLRDAPWLNYVTVDTLAARVAKTAEIVAGEPGERFIVWHGLEAERKAILKAIPGAVDVHGSQDLDEREARTLAFERGETRVFASKPILSGSGCNFQKHCRRAVFAGLDFKFHDFIQAVHRLHRFQQPRRVVIDMIYADTEREIVRQLKTKWVGHERLADKMSDLIKQYGLASAEIVGALERSLGVERVEASGRGWRLVCDDSVDEAARMPGNSVDAIVTSIPFGTQYEYTTKVEDFGHAADDAEFWRQMDHLTPNLLRVLKPGRVAAIHCKDRNVPGSKTGLGYAYVEPFSDDTAAHFRRHGFIPMGRVTVGTDVVRENNQTHRLTHCQILADGTKVGCGLPEYILLFRKPQTDRGRAFADQPVTHTKDTYPVSRWQIDAESFWRAGGDRLVTPDEWAAMDTGERAKLFEAYTRGRVYDYGAHLAIGERLRLAGALPGTFTGLPLGSWSQWVWTNSEVLRIRTLNTERARRAQQAHVCPLPLELAGRLVERFTNPGETVFDPFMGLGTVGLEALRLGREAYGCELSALYWGESVNYLKTAEQELAAPTLFDLIGQDPGM
jgi:DNA modification methylase